VENHASLHYAVLPAQPGDGWLAAWLPWLPSVKRASIERLREEADRTASVLGIALLGAALRRRGLAFDPGALEYPSRGKPRLRGAPDFSIAHAGGLVACALARRGRVGLDLEPRDAVKPEQLRLVLEAGEFDAVAAGAMSATDAWVMKEAVLKAAGRGVDAARDVVLHGRTAVFAGEAYSLVRVDVARSHVAWLATDFAAAEPGATGGAEPCVELVAHEAADVLALPDRT
jgi:4'-phosphopantetheinyl transferase